MYDAQDGIELVRIPLPTPVSHFAFTVDSALVARAGDDSIMRIWTSGLPLSDR